MPYSVRSTTSSLLNQQLMIFIVVLFNVLVISGNEVNISEYYITGPDLFTGGNFNSECNILAPSPNVDLLGCLIPNSLRLIDGITGEGSPLNTDLFVGWDRQSQDTFIIAPEFESTIPPKQVDIYFYNNPMMGIGLPPVDMLFLAYNNPHLNAGPISFTYSNNQNLIQNSNNTTMISVVITTDYEAEAYLLPFSHFWLQFSFSSTNLNQSLISEIKIFTEVNITSISEISFLSVTDDVDLGKDNLVPSVELSCTVANEGLFSWKWTDPSGAEVDASRASVLIADLTLTSILVINNFSLSDAGQYTCTASELVSMITRSSTISITAKGNVSTTGSLTTTTGQNISMTCDFSGYHPANYSITWTGPQGDDALTTSGRYTITIDDGLGQSQSGGDLPGPSVLSTLAISNVEETDDGAYYCSMMGTNGAQLMGSVELSVIAIYTTTPLPPSIFSSSYLSSFPSLFSGQSPSSTNNTQSIPTGSLLAVVFGVCVIFLLLIIGLLLVGLMCFSKKRRKAVAQAANGNPEPLDAIYEDPDAVLNDNFQPSFLQNTELKIADNVAYSTQLQVLQGKEVVTQDNVAYSAVNAIS